MDGSAAAQDPAALHQATPHAGDPESGRLHPLIVDLDRDGLPPSLAAELVICALRTSPAAALAALAATRGGIAAFERSVAAIGDLDTSSLLILAPTLAAARQAQAEGRQVILLTATHAALARRLCETRDWANDVIAAPGGDAVAERARAAAVQARCPEGFVVLPQADPDASWARNERPFRLVPAAAPPGMPRSPPSAIRVWLQAARLHQWTKNLLVVLPLLLAGKAFDPASWRLAATGFLAFGLLASATYLINDLHDLADDRAHRTKRCRPLAAGALPIPHAVIGIGIGLVGGLALAQTGGHAAAAVLATYLVATLAYTFAIKRHVIVDVGTLAALFTLRIVAGVEFCNVPESPWLLVLSMFVFTSLALAKRFVEIQQLADTPRSALSGRGYVDKDGPVVLGLGIAASAAGVLIFALYIVEAAARQPFYVDTTVLWMAPTALFLWLGRIWILCGRGTLRDDPVEFAVTDPPSLVLGLVVLASFALATLGA